MRKKSKRVKEMEPEREPDDDDAVAPVPAARSIAPPLENIVGVLVERIGVFLNKKQRLLNKMS